MAARVVGFLLCFFVLVRGQMHNAPSQNAVDHPVQLVGGTGSVGEGRVEIYVNGTWSTVCDTSWDEPDAEVVCRQLGFDSPLVYAIGGSFYGRGAGPVVMDRVTCTGAETDLASCTGSKSFATTSPAQISCSPTHQAGVLCKPYDVPIRLSGGSSLSEGRVELFVNGEWGTVCDAGWTKQDAQVVCTQLGFGNVRAQPIGGAFFGEGSGPIAMDGVTCSGLESNLVTCPFHGFDHHTTCSHRQDAGVICNPLNIPVRLNGDGENPLAGRVELYVRGEWGTVCSSSWTQHDADVVCNQLGFNSSRAMVIDGGLFGEADGPVFLDQVTCTGSESHIAACAFSGFGHHSCTHQSDAGVLCMPLDLPVRLVGKTPGEGRVEIKVGEQWGTVCDDYWDEPDARVVCSQLGFRSSTVFAFGKAFFGQGVGPIMMDDMRCIGTEAHLALCPFTGFGKHTCTHAQDAGVMCSPENYHVRLWSSGDTKSEGRVEIRVNGTWGMVCDDSWSAADAEVLCRQLGFNSPHPLAVTGSFFGQGSSPYFMGSVRCSGGEDHLSLCPSTNFGHPACSQDKDAGVICEPMDIPVRLVGGSESEGRVELNINGQWGTVCDTNWDAHDAQVVCRQLGFNTSVVLPLKAAFYGEGTGPILMYNVNCARSEPHLALCPFQGFGYQTVCTHLMDAGVMCQPLKAEVRLASKAQGEGRVEVKVNGLWTSICSPSPSYWGVEEAAVICRQMGFNSSVVIPIQNAYYGEGDGPIYMSYMNCAGTETHILMCPNIYGNGLHLEHSAACTHGNDAGVMCQPFDVRLVDGGNQFEGRVEVLINNDWGSVCDSAFGAQEAQVICRQLGLNTTGVKFWPGAHFGEGNGPIPIYNLGCTGTEDYLAQCPFNGFNTGSMSACAHTQDAGVTCG